MPTLAYFCIPGYFTARGQQAMAHIHANKTQDISLVPCEMLQDCLGRLVVVGG